MKVPLFFIFTIFFSGALAQGTINADTIKASKTAKESANTLLTKKKPKLVVGKVFKEKLAKDFRNFRQDIVFTV